MNHINNENLELNERLLALQQLLADETPTSQGLEAAKRELSRITDCAGETTAPEFTRATGFLDRVVDLAACLESQPESQSMVKQLAEFFREFIPELSRAAKSDSDEPSRIEEFIQSAEERWSDYLDLLDDGEMLPETDDWSPSLDSVENTPDFDVEVDESEDVPNQQVELLLSALADSALPADEDTGRLTEGESPFPADTVKNFELDRELLEAYLDDANRCLSSMEQAALAMESSPDATDSIPQFCRELHTLKGASATVGLSELASYLHELETSLQELFADTDNFVTVEPLFEAVDRVRAEIANLTPAQSNTSSLDPVCDETNRTRDTTTTATEFAPFTVNDDSSIRIRAAKLDRLMDMLAELVVLRNRRESNVGEFNLLNKELAACASRLNLVEKQQVIETDTGQDKFPVRNGSNTLSEVAEDIGVVFQGLRELQKPVNQDNIAISRFIRDFRQELMQLRRIPVSGLFNRLQRAARNVAKQENKQVQVKLVGQNAGLEQEIQERLFESLLHIVRNAVSHGIESESERKDKGKNPIGTVTLEANTNAQLLVIEVRDDGNGIDFDAIRRRAIEKGLLAASQFPSDAELAELIFHPGFSTREQASEVSGRGVGMNIVANTINQLHGRVEVDSVPGQGSTMRLLIPLRTGIEHVMVFRCEDQLFALPMESVTAAKTSNSKIGNVTRLTLSSTSSAVRNESESENVLLLKGPTQLGNTNHAAASQNTQVALAVDELIGPEEVVVRGLPNLLKRHPLFCGVTLSGSGESVLLLNGERVLQFCDQQASGNRDSCYDAAGDEGDATGRKRVLVIDDSLTARRVLVKLLQKYDFNTLEAGDGIEAIEILHRETFDLVLTDLDMPRLGGLELLADIQSGRFCEAPVAVVSSRDEETFRSKAMDLGATEYLTKPVSKKSLAQLLENLELLPELQKG